jgi:hypothetical protein
MNTFKVGDLVIDSLTNRTHTVIKCTEKDNLVVYIDSDHNYGERYTWEVSHDVDNPNELKRLVATGRIEVEQRMTIIMSKDSTLGLSDHEIATMKVSLQEDGRIKLYKDVHDKTRVVIKFRVKRS